MKLNSKKLVPVIAIAVVAYYLYWRKKNKTSASEPTKIDNATLIVSTGNSTSFPALMNLDEAYIGTWAAAIRASQPTFIYGGKTYNTKGGKVKL